MKLRKLGSAVGAELTGLDLAQPLEAARFAPIRQALLDHGMIVIRDQGALTPDQQIAFARLWGDISIHPYTPSIEGYPGLMKISGANAITQTWHSDTTHAQAPPALTILLARTLPPVGGDTMFASAVAAHDALSPGLQATLAGLKAVHQGTASAADAGKTLDDVTSVHPVVRTHPETGRKALFVNDNYVRHFAGWSVEDSRPLLDLLYAAIGRPEHVYRHRWQAGDLLVWDNRIVQHAVVGDAAGGERTLHRLTIAGDIPA